MNSKLSEQGFTLVEVLVSLIVGALLLSSLGWVIGALTKDLKSAETQQHSKEILHISKFLERVFVDARFADDKNNPLPRSQGVLNFQMRAPEASGKDGYVTAKLSVSNGSGGKALKIAFPGTELPEAGLISGAKDIAFSYDQNEDRQNPNVFLERIAITVQKKDVSAPDIINLRPRINAVGTCVFDPISQQCRS